MGGQRGLCGKDVAPDTAMCSGSEGDEERHVCQPAWLQKLLRKMLTKHHEVSHYILGKNILEMPGMKDASVVVVT